MKQPELGKKITALRQQKGLTQEELVALCNINVRTIQRIEAGEVTPRSYTIKTIFSVLDCDLEAFQSPDQTDLSEISDARTGGNFASILKFAWIGGVIYLLTGFAEFAIDYARFFEEDLIIGKTGYIIMKLIVLGSFFIFLRGFLISGRLYKNYLLKIGAIFLIGISSLFYAYDIISLFYDLFNVEYVVVVQSIFYGIGGLLFGFAMIKLAKPLGTIAMVAGGLEIACSFMFLTIFLGWLGLIFLIPTLLVQIVLLFKIEEKIRARMVTII